MYLFYLGDNINIDINLFQDAKKYCNKIWQSVRFSQVCLDPVEQTRLKKLTINQVSN